MASRQVKTSCCLCPNQCSCILEVSEEGLVTEAWKIYREQSYSDNKKRCNQLNNVLDKNLDNAKAILQRLTHPPIVIGGH